MKFRAFILVACMLVVPGMAMFSHRLPAEVRASLRRHLCDPAHRAMQAAARALSLTDAAPAPEESPFLAASSPPNQPAPSAPGTAVQPVPSEPRSAQPAAAPVPAIPARVVMPTVTVAPANAITPPVAPTGSGLAVPIATSRAAARSFSTPPSSPRKPTNGPQASGIRPPPEPSTEPFPLATPAESPSAGETSEPPLAPIAEQANASPEAVAVHSKLQSLGAFAVDCQPLAGTAAGYASSCRLNVDANGELHRMFYGKGPDAAAALRSLVEQVEDWQRRRSPASAARL